MRLKMGHRAAFATARFARSRSPKGIVGSIRVHQDQIFTEPIEMRIEDSVIDATEGSLPAIDAIEGVVPEKQHRCTALCPRKPNPQAGHRHRLDQGVCA